MKINRLVIENFKSIERIELIEPNPFTVFVGPNGSGKSTIFEGLEFMNLIDRLENPISLFGGQGTIRRRQNSSADFRASVLTAALDLEFTGENRTRSEPVPGASDDAFRQESHQFSRNFSRLFVGNDSLVKLRINDDQRLSLSANNLEKVLKRVLTESVLRNEIFEWLELFVPEFKGVEVVQSPFSGEDTLLWYERYAEKPFTKDLISDGTYNILALLIAIYQSDDKPQFLCIEEPENGLHPQVAGELVDFFRIMCEQRGHYIWLNTHSQSMMSRLKADEMVVVEKRKGITTINQYQNRDVRGLRMDEALLTNFLGAGLPW